METRGRALYNLIRMNALEDPTFAVEDWQVEDYKALDLNVLFERLTALGISLDENRFLHYADAHSSPEELMDTLWVDEDLERYDEAYLLVFELWRRLVPEKQSLSIFCDHFDYLIEQYDNENISNEEEIQNALVDLERILDESVDQGEDPHLVFEELSLYLAHDLESFIYDFAAEQIDEDHPFYASELIDGFDPYIRDEKWFDFLRLRLMAQSDPEEAENMLARILDEQREEPDFELLLEIARFLIHRGSISHFTETINIARELIHTEQDFQELLAISSEFCRLLDKEEVSQKMGEILKKRQGKILESEVVHNDPSIEEYYTLFEDLDRSEA